LLKNPFTRKTKEDKLSETNDREDLIVMGNNQSLSGGERSKQLWWRNTGDRARWYNLKKAPKLILHLARDYLNTGEKRNSAMRMFKYRILSRFFVQLFCKILLNFQPP